MMQSQSQTPRWMFWTGWVISLLPILMIGVMPIFVLIFAQGMMADGMKKYGYPSKDMLVVVSLEIGCGIIYAIPQTAVLGAILMTGYLGGAVATHLHADELPQICGPVLFGLLAWLGLYFRDARLRRLVPWRW